MEHSQLNEEQRNRVESCREAIDAVLDNYKCALVPTIVIMQGNIVSHNVGIWPQKEESRIVVPTIKSKEIPKRKFRGR